jgi:hypothetical protein
MDVKRIAPEELKAALAGEIDQLVAEVAEAMNTAQPGRIIADSEEPVRDANAVFREQLYQKALDLLQAKQEAFSPSAHSDRSVAEQGQASDQPSDD